MSHRLPKTLHFFRLVSSLAPGVLLSACTLGLPYREPEVVQPARFHNAPAIAARAQDVVRHEAWWRSFNDPMLARIVARAGSQNLDIAVAAARVEQSRAAAKSAGAALRPRGDFRASNSQVSQSLLDPIAAIARDSPGFERGFSQNDFGVAASWELDLFGGLRKGREAARSEFDAAEAGREAVRLSVTAEAADAYFQLRGYQSRLEIAQRQQEMEESLSRLLAQRATEGLGSERELHLGLASLESVKASMPPLYAGVQAQVARLGVLMGGLSDSEREELERAGPLPDVPGLQMAEGPKELLRTRPDIVAAERKLSAANARVGASLAEYYPNVSLSALLGITSIESSKLFTHDALDRSVGLGLRWRLFDFGRIDAEVASARGREAELLAVYQGTVLRATAEVETSLSELVQQEARAGALDRQIRELRLAREQSRMAFEGGVVSLIEVLDTDRQLLAASDQLSLARAGAARASVACFRAFGGGWRVDEAIVSTAH